MKIIPATIRTGMRVIDAQGREIGTVDGFRFSENEDMPEIETADLEATDRRQEETLIEAVADALVPDDMPEELEERMLREGYVRLDPRNVFLAHRYILPEQIESLDADRVVLNVALDSLLKR